MSFVAAFIPNVADSFLIETLQLVSGMNVLRSDGYSAVRRVRMPSVVADESEFTTITSKSGWSCAIIAGMDSSRYAEFELFANTITDIGAGWLPLAAEHFFNCLFNADLRRIMYVACTAARIRQIAAMAASTYSGFIDCVGIFEILDRQRYCFSDIILSFLRCID